MTLPRPTLPLRAEKWQADDGSIWCTIWYPFESDPEVGFCFDFPYIEIDDMIRLLKELKGEEAA